MFLIAIEAMESVWRMGSPPLKSTSRDRPTSEAKVKNGREAVTRVDDTRIYREKAAAAMSLRELIPCVSHAPYAQKGDYLADLGDEEEYLRPKSSHG